MKRKITGERGQILVIFVLALTGLLGFVALAIDSGLIYSDRRYSQSVADGSSMAGAGAAAQTLERYGITYGEFTCQNARVLTAVNDAYTAARTRATQNNVTTLDNNLADKHGIEIICVNLPNQLDRYLDVHTRVSSTVNTSFMHLFYRGAAVNTVDAVVRVRPRTEMTYGNAIVSLNNQNDSGIDFDGGVEVEVDGGGIFSNSVITGNGSFDVEVDHSDAGISYVALNGLDINGRSGDFDPNPVRVTTPIVFTLAPPVCGNGTPVKRTKSGNITPGNYSGIDVTKGTLNLAPGLYCLSGDFNIRGEADVNGSGVTLYFTNNANYYVEGSADVQLSAPGNSPVGGALTGVLIYLAQGNTGEVRMLGDSDNTLGGIIYAPSGTIEAGGNSRVETPGGSFTQLIAHDVVFHGNTEVTISYTDTVANTLSPKIDLIQ